jgi:hypothetical protein
MRKDMDPPTFPQGVDSIVPQVDLHRAASVEDTLSCGSRHRRVGLVQEIARRLIELGAMVARSAWEMPYGQGLSKKHILRARGGIAQEAADGLRRSLDICAAELASALGSLHSRERFP